ncbi:DNA-directed DNA polymerase eta rad30 [Ceratobasidium sp. 428]|nr:DNA-directed DNA polymerase eta rad30 [Ceratobasidium sp. 428]
MPFQKIRFLGGKLGDAIAAKFEATTVEELKEIDLEDMQRRFGEESIWVWNVLRGIDYSEVKERTSLKSMAASKNVRPAITTFDQARHWLAVLAAELAVRLTDARKINGTVWPRTIVLHARQGSSTPRSKQIAFPFVRAFSAATILAPGERLWKMLFPGSADINPGVINIMLGFGGLESFETGQRGIEGFLGAKGATSAKPNSTNASTSAKRVDASSSSTAKAQRRTASPSIRTKTDAPKSKPKPKSKHDFFGAAKRKAIELVDDSSDSDIVEILPPPRAKRTNTGSSGQTGGSSRGETPAPVVSLKDKDKNASSDKGKSKSTDGIELFFAIPEPSEKAGKK